MGARQTAVLVWAVCVVVALATLVLLALGAGESTPGDSFGLGGFGGLSFVFGSLAFGTVGALVVARVPDNPIGAVLCLLGVLLGLGDLAYQYADYALFVSPSLPAGDTAAWLQNLGLPPSFGLLAVALLLFPDGRLPSRRWRPALGLALVGVVLIVVGYAFRPGPLDDPFETVSNPLGIAGAYDLTDAAGGFGWMSMGISVALAAAALVVRLRRSIGYERQQLKWIAFAAAVTGVAVVADVVSFFASLEGDTISQLRIVLVGIGFSAFPLAAGMAILRYRLFDIDVVINRTLVYGALTATLAAAYLGCVLLLQLILGGITGDSSLAVAGSTLAVAALFRPARARIQGAVDRRFYRRKYDAAQTLERFGEQLRDEVDLGSLTGELRSVVTETMQPAHVSVWLRTAGA
jgi:xanthosine utilization system XapX-like protein